MIRTGKPGHNCTTVICPIASNIMSISYLINTLDKDCRVSQLYLLLQTKDILGLSYNSEPEQPAPEIQQEEPKKSFKRKGRGVNKRLKQEVKEEKSTTTVCCTIR